MNIGIVGSGMIVGWCLEALQVVPNIKCTAICVRKPRLEEIRQTAEKYKISNIYLDYNKMLQDVNIDFVYIGIINSLHFEYAKKALQMGKHVICEKPFTSTSAELMELIQLAQEKELYLFEAITVLYSPNYHYIQQQISKISPIKAVQCNFSQYSSRYNEYLKGNILPVFNPNLSGGALYDLNIYNIHFVIGLFGMPEKFQYIANLGFNGIDTSGILTMKYDRMVAVCTGAKDSSSPNYAIIQGEKGYIQLKGAASICESVLCVIEGSETYYNANKFENHMVNEFIAFKKIYQENNIQECYHRLEQSFNVMTILEQAKNQYITQKE